MPVTPPPASGGGGGSVVFYDEGSAIGTGTILNFVGAGVTGTFSSGTAIATISGGTAAGSVVIREEGTAVGTATDINFVGTVTTATFSGGTATITTTGGVDDPVSDIFGAADTAYEFDAALSGWTTLGAPDTANADSTVPDHYYVYKAATGAVALTGIYRATGTFPQTFIAKLSDHTIVGIDYARIGGLFVGEATPGVIEAIYLHHNTDWTVGHERYTNPTTYSATVGTNLLSKAFCLPIYYGIVVNSSTDVDFWYSFGGRTWRKRTDARNPSITVGSFGVFVDPENATHGAAGAFDFIRVWNSAKTFPGF